MCYRNSLFGNELREQRKVSFNLACPTFSILLSSNKLRAPKQSDITLSKLRNSSNYHNLTAIYRTLRQYNQNNY
jgi:hypothetical protein